MTKEAEQFSSAASTASQYAAVNFLDTLTKEAGYRAVPCAMYQMAAENAGQR